MLKFLKNWTLPIAMLVGAVGYPVFISFSFPYSDTDFHYVASHFL